MNFFLNSLRKDPTQVESYNTAVDLNRVGVVLLMLAVFALALAIGKTGNTIQYISDVQVKIAECNYDEHYKRNRSRSTMRSRKYKVYWAKFHGKYADGSELTITQLLNRELYDTYRTSEWKEEDHTMKLYRSDDTGKMYLSLLEPKQALEEYQSINKGTMEIACGYGGLVLLVCALSFFSAGRMMQKRARSYYRPISNFNDPYFEEAKRAEQQRMYDDAAKIFDEHR